MSDIHTRLAYLHHIGFSQVRIRTMYEQDISPDTSIEELISILGITTRTQDKIRRFADKITPEYVIQKLDEIDAKILHINDEEYPRLLGELEQAPVILYYQGILANTEKLISIVGPRKHSHTCEMNLQKIIPDLTQSGYQIVSGGAYGIDSLAHSIALQNGGITHAIVGTGLDISYPSKNKSLFRTIQETGSVISCFPLGTKPEAYNFPIRNEIVAGMSKGILVAEAAIKSGTLITARLALENDRDMFAIPGDISRPQSEGSNILIQQGLAKMTLSSHDILGEYGDANTQEHTPIFENSLHQDIYQELQNTPQDIDTLSEALNISVSELSVQLSMMEIYGNIESKQGKYFAR